MTLQFSPQTRRVFHLSLPIFAELLLQLLVGNMDQFMISHFGSAAVAAIGNGNQVMNVVIIVLTTMSTAATIDGGAAPEGCLGQRDLRFFFILIGLRLRAGHLFLFQEERIPLTGCSPECVKLLLFCSVPRPSRRRPWQPSTSRSTN